MPLLLGKAVGGVFTGALDVDEARRALAVLPDPNHFCQLVGIPQGIAEIHLGNDVEALLIAAQRLNGCQWTYLSLNPLKAALTRCATAAGFAKRRWLMFDVDPERLDASGGKLSSSRMAATAEEHARAYAETQRLHELLAKLGFPPPMANDSGNGYQTLQLIDLPHDPASRALVGNVLRAVNLLMHPWDRCSLGVECNKITQATKLPGTWARKGDNSPQRPFRLVRNVCRPDVPILSSVALLSDVAAPLTRESISVPELPFVEQPNLLVGRALPPSGGPHPYALAVLERCCRELAQVAEGGRHDATFRQAAAVGNYLESGQLDPRDCQQRLLTASLATGLSAADAIKTVADGLRSGQATPKPIPESNGHVRSMALPAPPAEPSGWEQPIPLEEVRDVPAFPLVVLPNCLRRFVEEVAAAKDCPPDYVAVPLLTIGGAAIGTARTLRIKPGWEERPCLYTITIAPPASGKSPSLRDVARPVYQEQQRLHEAYRCLKKSWQENDDTKEPKPTPTTILVDDFTVEKMAAIMHESPRGQIAIQDELTALVSGMNQYKAGGKGNDRAFYCKNWSGEPIIVHRKNQEDGPLLIANPFCAITGNLPPACLPRLRDERAVDDGFLDRFLPSFQQHLPMQGEDWLSTSDEAMNDWKDCWQALRGFLPEQNSNGQHRPHYVNLTPGGRDAWQEWTTLLAAQVNHPNMEEHLKGPWAKLKAYCARLALITHCFWQTTGYVADDDVSEYDIANAALLIAYFQGHARRVYAALDADPRAAPARLVLAWLARDGSRDVFRRSECYRDLRRSFKTPEAMNGPLDLLVHHRFLMEVEGGGEPFKPGRKPTASYRVNPLWKRSH